MADGNCSAACLAAYLFLYTTASTALSSTDISAAFPGRNRPFTSSVRSCIPVITKEVLRQRTNGLSSWVEAFARNHGVHIEWAEKGVRKEDHPALAPAHGTKKRLRRLFHLSKHGTRPYVSFLACPNMPPNDPNYRILAPQRSRFMHYYFYIRDEVLGPMMMRVASFFPFQTTYWINGHSFIEKQLNFLGRSVRPGQATGHIGHTMGETGTHGRIADSKAIVDSIAGAVQLQ